MHTMNGKQQVEAYAKLVNREQRAPWQPDELAGFRVGDMVRLPGFPAALRVIRLADPLLILKGPHGREIKAGWKAVERVRGRKE